MAIFATVMVDKGLPLAYMRPGRPFDDQQIRKLEAAAGRFFPSHHRDGD